MAWSEFGDGGIYKNIIGQILMDIVLRLIVVFYGFMAALVFNEKQSIISKAP